MSYFCCGMKDLFSGKLAVVLHERVGRWAFNIWVALWIDISWNGPSYLQTNDSMNCFLDVWSFDWSFLILFFVSKSLWTILGWHVLSWGDDWLHLSEYWSKLRSEATERSLHKIWQNNSDSKLKRIGVDGSPLKLKRISRLLCPFPGYSPEQVVWEIELFLSIHKHNREPWTAITDLGKLQTKAQADNMLQRLILTKFPFLSHGMWENPCKDPARGRVFHWRNLNFTNFFKRWLAVIARPTSPVVDLLRLEDFDWPSTTSHSPTSRERDRTAFGCVAKDVFDCTGRS
jgi:hypothetical protein